MTLNSILISSLLLYNNETISILGQKIIYLLYMSRSQSITDHTSQGRNKQELGAVTLVEYCLPERVTDNNHSSLL